MSKEKQIFLFIMSLTNDKEFYKDIEELKYYPDKENINDNDIEDENTIIINDNNKGIVFNNKYYKPFKILDDAIAFGKLFNLPFIIYDNKNKLSYSTESIIH